MADKKDSSLVFFSKATSNQWSYVLSLYSEVLKVRAQQTRGSKKGGPQELIKLDNWYQEQLPKIIQSRKDRFVTHEELVQITKWKLWRGKNRARILDLVRINTETSVLQISKKAFRKLPNLSGAITALTTLKGIGPATASAVLTAGAPDQCPYMADESMLATPGIEATDYTVAEYLNFSEQIKSCSDRLNEQDSDSKWNPHKVELCLWTHYWIKQLQLNLLNDMPLADGSIPKAIRSEKDDDSFANIELNNSNVNNNNKNINENEGSNEIHNSEYTLVNSKSNNLSNSNPHSTTSTVNSTITISEYKKGIPFKTSISTATIVKNDSSPLFSTHTNGTEAKVAIDEDFNISASASNVSGDELSNDSVNCNIEKSNVTEFKTPDQDNISTTTNPLAVIEDSKDGLGPGSEENLDKNVISKEEYINLTYSNFSCDDNNSNSTAEFSNDKSEVHVACSKEQNAPPSKKLRLD